MANSGQVKDGASHALTLQKFDVCCFPFKWSPKHANLQIGPPAPREATNLFCARCTSRVLGDARLSPGPEPEGMNGRIRSEAAVRAGSRQECVNTCVNLSGGGGCHLCKNKDTISLCFHPNCPFTVHHCN